MPKKYGGIGVRIEANINVVEETTTQGFKSGETVYAMFENVTLR